MNAYGYGRKWLQVNKNFYYDAKSLVITSSSSTRYKIFDNGKLKYTH